jgi:hypothetical protein
VVQKVAPIGGEEDWRASSSATLLAVHPVFAQTQQKLAVLEFEVQKGLEIDRRTFSLYETASGELKGGEDVSAKLPVPRLRGRAVRRILGRCPRCSDITISPSR